jgi:hypothetical protein
MSKRLHQVLLFVAPTLVGLLNLTHPRFKPPVFIGIVHHISWWLTLHILNLALFPLLGLAAFILVRDTHNFASALTKVALAIFIPIYAAFDAIAGIGTGILVENAKSMAPDDIARVAPLIDAYWKSNVLNTVAAAGSIAWVIAMLSAAVAFTAQHRRRLVAALAVVLFVVGGWAQTDLFLPSLGLTIPIAWWLITLGLGLAMFLLAKPRVPATLLVLSGTLFGASHVFPTGPLGMLCFLGAAVYTKLVEQKPAGSESVADVTVS